MDPNYFYILSIILVGLLIVLVAILITVAFIFMKIVRKFEIVIATFFMIKNLLKRNRSSVVHNLINRIGARQ